MRQVESVGSQTRRTRLKRLLKDAGEDGIRFVRRTDPDRQRRLLDIDDSVDTARFDSDADMSDWRHRLAAYHQRSAIGSDEIDAHIDNAYRAATSGKMTITKD